jgi:hypothetical protein
MSVEQNRKDKEKRMAEAGRENTQDLIQKDLLLDTSDETCNYILGNGFCGMSRDSNMQYCIKHTDNAKDVMFCKCENCNKEIEYYPEDTHPLGDEGWCYTCKFGVDEDGF